MNTPLIVKLPQLKITFEGKDYYVEENIARIVIILLNHNEKVEGIKFLRTQVQDLSLLGAKLTAELLQKEWQILLPNAKRTCSDYASPRDTEADGYVYCGHCGQRR